MKNILSISAAAFLALPLAAAITLVSPEQGSEVSLHNKGQKEFLTMSRVERRAKFSDKEYRKKMVSYGYYPVPVKLLWQADGSTRGPYTVLLSEKADFSCPEKIVTDKTEAAFINLKIATAYWWKVTAASGETKSGSFRSAELAPRLIRVDGVPNIRDLGGRKGLNGKRVRQSMIYRSAGLNDNAAPIFTPQKNYPSDSSEKILYDAAKADLESMKKPSGKAVAFVPGNEWTVFAFDKKKLKPEVVVKYMKEFKTVPAELDGVKGQIMKADSADGIRLPRVSKHRLAVLMREFDSPAEGRMAVSCGGDWYWVMIVNGRLVLNCLPGNLTNSEDLCCVFEIPVRKGKNQMIVLLGSGTGGRQWCFARPRAVSGKEIARTWKAMNKAVLQAPQKVTGYRPGKSRVEGASGEYMRNALGIRSDIDLRSDRECFGMTGSPLGKTVTWFHYSSSSYGGMKSQKGKEAFARVFRVFLDEKNYPVDFHCIAGQDRTGAVAFILNGLLGVDEDQLYLDWETTGFWNPRTKFNHRLRFEKLVAVFNELPGKNMMEKCEIYVKSCGFSDKDIARFRSIMLE